MILKLVYNREAKKLDHLALFDVSREDVRKVKSIKGHQWVASKGYNAYPIRSLWAVMATFPGIAMSPGVRRLWDKANNRDGEVDIFTERSIDIPRFRYEGYQLIAR